MVLHTQTQVYGNPLKSLMTFTHMGKPLPSAVVRRQYLIVLDHVQNGNLHVRLRSVLSTVMKKRHVFRGGTSIDEDDKERRQYYTDLIAECKEELANSAPAPVVRTRTRKKTITNIRKKFVMYRTWVLRCLHEHMIVGM